MTSLLYRLFGDIIGYKLFFLQNEFVLKLDFGSIRDFCSNYLETLESGWGAVGMDLLIGWNCQMGLDLGYGNSYLRTYSLSTLVAKDVV